MHRSVCHIQTKLIMCPCGPQIHIHRHEHVFIDPTVFWGNITQKGMNMKKWLVLVRYSTDDNCGKENEKTTHTHTHTHILRAPSLFKLASCKSEINLDFALSIFEHIIHFTMQKTPHNGLFSVWKYSTIMCQSVKWQNYCLGELFFQDIKLHMRLSFP